MALLDNNTILDNSENLKMSDLLCEMLNPEQYDECMIATGFWDIPGMVLVYSKMLNFLQAGKKIRLIIGSTPEVKAYQLENGFDITSHPEKTITQSLEELKVKDEYKDVIKLLMQYCQVNEEGKTQFRIKKYGRSIKDQFLHAKCYIVCRPEVIDQNGKRAELERAKGVIGSSNFTYRGLTDNAELNYFENNSLIVDYPKTNRFKGHISWFEEIWNSELAEDWNGSFIEILKKSNLGQAVAKEIHDPALITPYEAYIRILQEEYGTLLDANVAAIIRGYLPQSYQEFDYQIQGVQWCAHIMQHFNGFMLSDVVGLGKTVVGLLLAKYYVEQIAPQNGREKKVMIIAPPSILKDWETTLKDFDENRDDKLNPWITPISIGSIDNADLSLDDDDIPDVDEVNDGDENIVRENGNELDLDDLKDAYGLILIDESHRFRHSNTVMYRKLEALIDKHVPKPYIGLISATPQNNEPQDLYNQIKLFERMPRDSHFEKVEACNIESFFAEMRRQYNELKTAKTDEMTEDERNRNAQALIEMSEEIRDKVLYDIMVRRTRRDISAYYESQISFPKVDGPNIIKYDLEGDLAVLFNDTIQKLVGQPVKKDNIETALDNPAVLGFYRYRATEFLKSNEHKSKYETGSIKVHDTSMRLANIMKILLVKRLESSFAAFKESLQNLKQYTQNMIDMWEHDAIYVCPQIDVNAVFRDAKEKAEQSNQWDDYFEIASNILDDKINKLKPEKNRKGQNRKYKRIDFKDDYIDKLRSDMRMINSLYDRWVSRTFDPKLEAFKDAMRAELFDAQKNIPQKLVIFTEAIATAEELKCHITHMRHSPLVITAKNRDTMRQEIKENFDANYPKNKQKNKYDVIITTDVLAEGINLHRANTILNYDTPWNATRLIQRIGRVNRIGSEQSVVYVYNFYPSDHGNAEINLKQNAFAKLQAFHAQFGGDNKVYSDAEVIPETDYNHWMEEVDGGESPVQKHIRALKAYKEKEPLRFKALCEMKSDIVTGYETGDCASYHVLKTSPTACGCFGVKFKDGTGKYIPVLELLDNISEQCTQQTMRIANLTPVDPQLIVNVYKQAKNRHIRQAQSREAIQANAIIDDWREGIEGGDADTRQRLNDISEIINGGNKSVAKKVIKFNTYLAQRDITMTNTERVARFAEQLTPNIHNNDEAKPYVMASIYQTKTRNKAENRE